ncbi:MAG: endonuclease/exonuclease/phosphatase family protein [Phycisphaerales bacterium]
MNRHSLILASLSSAVLACASTSALAQWDPKNGDWLKSDSTDVRIMTWNVQDGICSSNDKLDNFGDWNGIVRIIASLQPDVLILQECADNSGNGTGSGIDSISTLENVADLLIHGGTDIYNGNVPVGSYVQLFTGTGYDLNHVYVSESNDGFNRNMILSRFPFADLNGGGATFSTFALVPDEYQSGGTAGIRGYQFAEIDLPDELYAGDLVVGNGHLKAGGSSSDFDQREKASENIAYFIDYYYNGAGTGMSDPNNRISVPNTGTILDENTPVIVGGDLNQQPGNGPSEFIARAEFTGGTDGTDRDQSDSFLDLASQPISGDTSTQGSNSKLDYLIYQDSIVDARRSFIFRSTGSGMNVSRIPEPARTFPINPLSISGFASDHRPVVIDFIMPEAVSNPCPADLTGEGDLNFLDVSAYLIAFGNQDPIADFTGEGDFNFLDVSAYLLAFGQGCP